MDYRQLFIDYAEKQFALEQPRSLYEPIQYLMNLGGKAMRPQLLLLAHRLFSQDEQSIEKALPLAYAIELFHNFSLMHDDIMDAAPLRRGQATVHEKYDANTAILSGDVMLVFAYEYLAKGEAELLPEYLRVFNRDAVGVCQGQRLDMDFEKISAKDLAMQDYLGMIEQKTAVLLRAAMELGALSAGATRDEAELAGEFGRALGLAFQLQDDYLDSFGEDAKVGKRIGGDILQKKKTFLVLYALEQAGEERSAELLAALESDCKTAKEEEKKIKQVQKLFEDLGAKKALEQAVRDWTEEARDCLEQIPAPKEIKVQLAQFIQMLEKRQH